ncbi:MAG TPA: glutamate-1-semialdehyde 2,1-aminomutase [Chitinispirillaceae bacterium]|nr:glutamate-1-semialdehyde 2,1-aminomutase [Chitinispirillaceae bacterium]
MLHNNSIEAGEHARRVIPGGVNSPVRAFKSVGGNPVFFSKGKGSCLTDIDGNGYIDYVCAWGPLILGHAFPQVVEAVQKTVMDGTAFGAPTERETELAELIISMVPSIGMVRLVNSGTEATMSAVRLARGYTRRDLIVKFQGCYHGHGDSFLIAAGSGALTFGIPESAGVTRAVASTTLVAQYNDVESVENLFKQYGEQIAAVIVEPVAGNMGVILPEKTFLPCLREITKKYGALLIFDEVMTGFRLSAGGAQSLFGISPDLTTLGKIIGGGLPIAAYGGSKEIMSYVSPSGAVYQAGTLSGNPIAVAAGIEMLKVLRNDSSIYDELEKKTSYLARTIEQDFRSSGIECVCNQIGSMMTLFFTSRASVTTFADAIDSNRESFGRYFHTMLESGIYLPPSQFESWFISAAHSKRDIEITLEKSRAASGKIRGG